MHRRKYRALANASLPDWGLHLNDFRSECLRPVAEAYQSNFIRMSTVAKMPAWIALEVTRERLWLDDATVKTGGTIEPDLIKLVSEKINFEAVALFNQRIAEWRNTSDEVFTKLMNDIGLDWVEARLHWSQAISHGISALFETIVVESWTAFETLSRDLWTVTLDNDTGSIAERVSNSGVLQNARRYITSTFDSETHPGSFQVETRQATFQKLGDIKKLYGAAFPTAEVSLFDTVEDGYIAVLSAFRNVIVHNRGKYDRTFCYQLKQFPEFRSIKDGNDIELDGEMVVKMRNAALLLGHKLIQAADAELRRQRGSG